MKLTSSQLESLAESIRSRADHIAELIAKGVAQTACHSRPSAVNLIIKVQRNADEPRLIEVLAQEKIKAPKSKYSDLTEWDETENIVGYRIDEDPNQQFVPGTEPGRN